MTEQVLVPTPDVDADEVSPNLTPAPLPQQPEVPAPDPSPEQPSPDTAPSAPKAEGTEDEQDFSGKEEYFRITLKNTPDESASMATCEIHGNV